MEALSSIPSPRIGHCISCLYPITFGYMADIDLRHLEYFVAAAESRSFVRAAKLVNVSQPAITKSIQRMESWFGHALFERGAELKLTAFGEAMIDEAKRVLGNFDDLRQAAIHYGKDWSGTLKIGAGPLMAESLIGTAVGRLLSQHPELNVVIHVDQYMVFSDMLRARQLDFFVADIGELKGAGDFVIQKLEPSRLQWFCRKDHPLAKRKSVSFAELLEYPMIFPMMPFWAREWFAKHLPPEVETSSSSPPFRPAVVCSHFSTLKSIVMESDAMTPLTENVLRQKSFAKDFAMVNFAGMTPSTNAGIVSLKKRPLSPAALRLIEEVIAVSNQ